MRIIVEGPDGAGKTTLLTKLEASLGLTREPRRVGPDGKALEDIRNRVEIDLREEDDVPGQIRLYDRHAMVSGPIYSPISRPIMSEPWNDFGWLAEMTDIFWGQPNLLIFCQPPLMDVCKNVRRDAEGQLPALANPVKVDRMYWSYASYALNAASLRPEDTVMYDYTKTHARRPFHSLTQITNWLTERVNQWR